MTDGHDPYAAPRVATLLDVDSGPNNGHSRLFDGVLSSVWSKSHGIRLRMVGLSVVFWLSYIFVVRTVVAALADADPFTMTLVLNLTTVVGFAVASRFVALSMTQTYLNARRGQSSLPCRPKFWVALKASSLFIVGSVAGILLGVCGMALVIWIEPDAVGFFVLIALIWMAVSGAFAMLGWACNPYWSDADQGLFEGIRSGTRLLKRDPIGLMRTLALLAAVLVIPCFLTWWFVDAASKAVFAEAYSRLHDEPREAETDSHDKHHSPPTVISVEELRRLRGD